MSSITEKIEPGGEIEKVYFQVIEYIKEMAQKGELTFGSKIPSERELMATLGTSRNSIREALRTLENMGLIECRQGQGNFLVNRMGESLSGVFSMLLLMKQSNYIEISQLRRFIEIGAFLLATRTADEKDKDQMQEILEKIDVCPREERPVLDKQFHDEIIRASRNNLLQVLNNALSELFQTAIKDLALHIALEDWEKLIVCHKRVYRCLLEKDVHEGVKAIREHYNIIDENLEKYEEV